MVKKQPKCAGGTECTEQANHNNCGVHQRDCYISGALNGAGLCSGKTTPLERELQV